MQRAEARVPRRLNPPPPPSLPESTHHSFLIRGISREHENSERKEGVNGRQKPVEFLLSSDSKLVNHDTYIYIYFRSNPRETPRIPINCCRRVRARYLSTGLSSIVKSKPSFFFFFFFFFFCHERAKSSIYFGFIPGTDCRVLRGYYRRETVTS